MLFFFTEICWDRHQVSTSTTKNKQAKPIFLIFSINQTFLVNIYAENTANLQNRAGREFFGGVQPAWLCTYLHKWRLQILFHHIDNMEAVALLPFLGRHYWCRIFHHFGKVGCIENLHLVKFMKKKIKQLRTKLNKKTIHIFQEVRHGAG